MYRDVGISRATGTDSRKAWRALNAHLTPGYTLVVAAVDRIGRRWMDMVSTLRDLRNRQIRIRSLASSEEHWTRYFDADPDSPEAVIGDVLASFFTWAAQQELESIRRRTKAGLDKARSNGKTLGTPRKITDLKVEMSRSFRRDGLSFNQVGEALGVSRTTVVEPSRRVEVRERVSGSDSEFGLLSSNGLLFSISGTNWLQIIQ